MWVLGCFAMDTVSCCVGSIYKVDSELCDAQPMLRWFIVHLCALLLWIYLHHLGLFVSIQGLALLEYRVCATATFCPHSTNYVQQWRKTLNKCAIGGACTYIYVTVCPRYMYIFISFSVCDGLSSIGVSAVCSTNC